jgi:DNA primase
VAPYSPRIRTDGTVSFPVLPKDLRKIAPGDFTLATVPRRLGGAAVRLWTEAVSGAHQRLPASLLAE